jgi:hypothetical protein
VEYEPVPTGAEKTCYVSSPEFNSEKKHQLGGLPPLPPMHYGIGAEGTACPHDISPFDALPEYTEIDSSNTHM